MSCVYHQRQLRRGSSGPRLVGGEQWSDLDTQCARSLAIGVVGGAGVCGLRLNRHEPQRRRRPARRPARVRPRVRPRVRQRCRRAQPGGTVARAPDARRLRTRPASTTWTRSAIYTGEDLAFFGATIMRSLTQYKYSADPAEGDRAWSRTRRPTPARPTPMPRRGPSRCRTASTGRTARRSSARTSSTACRARSRPTSSSNGPTYIHRVPEHPDDTGRQLPVPGPLQGDACPAGPVRSGRRVRRQHDHLPPGQADRRLQLHGHARASAPSRTRPTIPAWTPVRSTTPRRGRTART